MKVGSDVTAAGTLDGDTFTAITVWIARPYVAGEVTGKTADTITVKRKDGSTATIHVSSTTTYAIRGDKTASLADIAVGGRVTAVGTLRADGSLDAASVLGKPAKPAKPTKPSTKKPERELGADDERGSGLSAGPSGPRDRPRAPIQSGHGLGRARRRRRRRPSTNRSSSSAPTCG